MIRRFLAADRANVTIEFGLCGLAFLTMLFGVVEFGRLMFTYHELAEASRIGARYAIVHGSSSGAPASKSDIANATAAATSLVTSTEVTVTFSPDNNPGSEVTVAIALPFKYLTGLISSSQFTLNSHATMVIAN
jgi:Flp pilus assembly protein TadG